MRNLITLIIFFSTLPTFAQTDTTFGKNYLLDTIPERNNPEQLDLAKHQLFIDTTRSSKYYRDILHWEPSEYSSELISSSIQDLKKDYKAVSLNIGKFPRLWVTLHTLNDKFVLYDRCDGIDRRFQLTDSSINLFGPLESDIYLNQKLLTLTDDEIEIEVQTSEYISKTQKAMFSIKRTESKNVYIMEHTTDNGISICYITPINRTKEFDVLVNHCPDRKVIEFSKFDKYPKHLIQTK